MIQEAVNKAITSAGIALAVAKGASSKAGSAEGAKGADAKAEAKENLSALDALPKAEKAKAALKEEEAAGSELQKRSDEVSEKASAQRAILEKGGLSNRQAGGRKGYITRMTRQQERIQEKLEARKFQAEAMKQRLEALRALHGEAWGRMGLDPMSDKKKEGK